MRKDKEQQEAAEEQVKSSDTVESKAAGQTEETSGAAKVADQETKTEDASEKMAAEIAEWRDKYVRLSAEFDNYRKRTLKEKMDLMSSAGEDVIKSLLPVMDDLERALAATEKASDVAAVREGVVLISNKLRDTLRGRGLAEIEAVGQELDTDFHEAVAKIPAQDETQKGRIIDVVQKGYKLNDKVIRHSKAVVGEKARRPDTKQE